MQIFLTLVHVPNNPNKLADASLVLDGSLEGFTLEGFQVWRSRDDPSLLNVTFPAREFKKTDGGKGFFSYVRPRDPSDLTIGETLKEAIIAAYREQLDLPAGQRRPQPPPSPRAIPVSKGGRKVAAPAAAAPPTAAPATPRLVRKPRTVADVPALALPILTPEAAEGIAAQISAMPRETAIEVASMIAGLAGLDIDNPPAVEPAPAVEAPAAAGVPLAELATVRAAVRKHARTLARRRKPVRKAVKRRRTSRKVARKAKARRPRRPVRKAAKRRQGGAR